jgi:hypothetical protein
MATETIVDIGADIQFEEVADARNRRAESRTYSTHEKGHNGQPSFTLKSIHKETGWQCALDLCGIPTPV